MSKESEELKRLEVKYIRDGAKAAYKKGTECYCCGATEELQLHHFASLEMLWERYKAKNKVKILSVEDIFMARGPFVELHRQEIYKDVVTLCKDCHMYKLHKVYGIKPLLTTAKAQKNWCIKQRLKIRGDTGGLVLDVQEETAEGGSGEVESSSAKDC